MTRPDFFLLEAVRHRRPLIHCISNLVSANDCANLALAVGASPIMAQAPEEMEAVAAVSAAAVSARESAATAAAARRRGRHMRDEVAGHTAH